MEVKKSFVKASTSRSQDKLPTAVDPSIITTFLETCMKLLHNSKAMKGLQELINKRVCNKNAPEGHYAIRKIVKHKTRTGHEMRLIVHIGDYEMDHVILDLGFDVNVCLNRHGREWGGLHCSGLQSN